MHTATDWHTIVSGGSYKDCPPPPHGPWHGRADADAALLRFLEHLGSDAGSFVAATSVRVVGPFASARSALKARMSNYEQLVIREGDLLGDFESHGLCIVDGQWVGELLTWPLPEMGLVEVARPRPRGDGPPLFERVLVGVRQVHIPDETWLSRRPT